jgi:hypothetical protein
MDELINVITLIGENDIKNDVFKNTFASSSLTIKKIVDGNLGDPDNEFTVTVTLSAKDGYNLNAGAINAPYADSAGLDDDGNYVAVYTVKHGSEFTIENIPHDVNYTVVETGNDEYNPKYDVVISDSEGEIKDDVVVTITNTRGVTVETGINLDNLPYILILGAATLGLVGFTMRKRFNNR